MKRLVFIAVILTFVSAASVASADTVLLAELGETNVTDVNVYAGGLGNISTPAGNFNFNVKLNDSAPATLISGYCVEPCDSSALYQPYELLPIADNSGYKAAAWVLSQGYTGPTAAAAQVAVWELTFDYQFNRSYDLAAGEFRYNSGLSAGQLADVKTIYDAALAAMPGFNASAYRIAHNPVGSTGWAEYQDYVVRYTTPKVEVAPQVYTICIGARTIKNAASDFRGDCAATVMYNKFKKLYNAAEPLIWTDSTTGGINKSDIEKTINDTKLKMKANDLLIIYITGHGAYRTSNDGACVLLGNYPLNTEWTEDQRLSDTDLYGYLQDMDDKSKWVIIDACHSGGFWTSLKQLKKIGFLAAASGGDNLLAFAGMTIWITSPNYGIFTSLALEDAFSKNSNGKLKADTDGQAGLSFEELASYASFWGRVSSFAGVVVQEMAFGDEVIFGPEKWNPTAAKTDNVAGTKQRINIAPILSLLLAD